MLTLVVPFFFGACATMHPAPAQAGPPPMAPIRYQAPEPVAATGSLWEDVRGSQIAGVEGVRGLGDLITVLVDESDSASNGATTDLGRSSEAGFGIETLLGLETSLVKANSNMTGGLNIKGGTSTATNGSGETTRNGSLSAVITCQVTEILPNNNLRIRGQKEIEVNHEMQYLVITGVLRQRDIGLDNTVASRLIADPKIEFSGQGVVSNQQGQGWGTTVANTIWPF